MGEGVASNDQPVATGEFERNVALCVARCVDDAQPGDNFIPRFDHVHLALDGGVVATRAGDEARALGRQAACRGVAIPEIPFRAGHVETCTGRHQFIEFVDRPPEMVGMAMGEDDLGDLRFVDTGGFEIVPQFARRRHEAIAGAHIDQDQIAAGADQRHVGRGTILLAGLAGRLE